MPSVAKIAQEGPSGGSSSTGTSPAALPVQAEEEASLFGSAAATWHRVAASMLGTPLAKSARGSEEERAGTVTIQSTYVCVFILHVLYAERGNEYGILFRFSLFCEYICLQYIHIHVIYRGASR